MYFRDRFFLCSSFFLVKSTVLTIMSSRYKYNYHYKSGVNNETKSTAGFSRITLLAVSNQVLIISSKLIPKLSFVHIIVMYMYMYL